WNLAVKDLEVTAFTVPPPPTPCDQGRHRRHKCKCNHHLMRSRQRQDEFNKRDEIRFHLHNPRAFPCPKIPAKVAHDLEGIPGCPRLLRRTRWGGCAPSRWRPPSHCRAAQTSLMSARMLTASIIAASVCVSVHALIVCELVRRL